MNIDPFRLSVSGFWKIIKNDKKIKLLFLILLILFASIFEVFTIGAVIPFLSVLIDPGSLFQNEYFSPVILSMGIVEPIDLILPVTLGFVFLSLFSGFIRTLLLAFQTRLSYDIGADLSLRIFERTIKQPFEFFLKKNSSEIIPAVSIKADQIVSGVIIPFLNMISSIFLLVFIFFALVFINPYITITSVLMFGALYFSVFFVIRLKLVENSKTIDIKTNNVVKTIQEGIGGIRDIIIDSSHSLFTDIFKREDRLLRTAKSKNFLLNHTPRLIIESIGIAIIAVVAYLYIQLSEVDNIIPTLGALALGSQRMLPLMNQVYLAFSSISGNYAIMHETLSYANLPVYSSEISHDELKFDKDITLKNVWFKYDESQDWVLKNINLIIKKGERVGIIGPTGCGKSTLLDLMMGLLSPSKGSVMVDGKLLNSNNIKHWQSLISHIPQNIFLLDDSIGKNIVFGAKKKEIDLSKVEKALKDASLLDFTKGLNGETKNFVGERGLRLSGGQKQRIGIARALYKGRDVIFLDEATSALDQDTEKNVMSSIYREKATLVMIAHRLSSLESCSRIVKLDSGSIKNDGKFEEICGKKV